MAASILVAYTTNAGSTTKVAEAIAEALGQDGTSVDVRRFAEVTDIGAYDAVVVGAPMIVGWHGKATTFVELHQGALSQVPVAYFFTALELTRNAEGRVGSVPIFQDPSLGEPPKAEGKLSFKERQTTPSQYLNPVLRKAPQVKPVSAGFFKGKLDYRELNPFHWLFVKILIRGEAGDYRNWDAIHEWARSLRQMLVKEV